MDLFEPAAIGNTPEFTVSELSGAVKRVIEGEFGLVRVRGEVGRVSRPGSGHVYLDLKDDRAVLGAVIWKTAVRGLGVQPEEGMEVVATGRLTTFPGASKYQMVIEAIAPAGLGALMAMLEKRRTALAAEGLFDAGRKRPLPFLPEVIGVVTSPSGAVIRDILHRLRERFPRQVLLWPVTVQGPNCATEVAAAIRGFNALQPGGRVPRPDVIIVARGGGSIEDLWGFNEEVVVRAAAASVVPLISAVGHETDTTLIDLAADLRAPTPTAAAELAVPVRAELSQGLAGLEARRRGAVARGLALAGQRLRDLSRGLPRPENLVAERAQKLDACAIRLPGALERSTQRKRLGLTQGPAGRFGLGMLAEGMTRRRGRVEGCAECLRPERFLRAVRHRGAEVERAALKIRHCTDRHLERSGQKLEGYAGRLRPEGLKVRLVQGGERLEARRARLAQAATRLTGERRGELRQLARTLASLDYRQVLARGFAVVRDEAGAVVTRAAAAGGAAALEIEFSDDRLSVRPDRSKSTAGRRRASEQAPDQGTLL